MTESGVCWVQIETKKDTDPSVDRVVTVKGNPEACWRVSFYYMTLSHSIER